MGVASITLLRVAGIAADDDRLVETDVFPEGSPPNPYPADRHWLVGSLNGRYANVAPPLKPPLKYMACNDSG